MSTSRTATLAGVFGVVGGLALATVLYRAAQSDADRLRHDLQIAQERLGTVSRRLSVVEDQIQGLHQSKEAGTLARAALSPTPAPQSETLVLAPIKLASPPSQKQNKSEPLDPAIISELQAKLMDAAAPWDERLKAFRELRKISPQSVTGDVLRGVAALVETAPDAGARASLCKSLKGITNPEASQILIGRLQADESLKVREEAADSLGPAKKDPLVRAALVQAARSDPSLVVRIEAEKSLDEAVK